MTSGSSSSNQQQGSNVTLEAQKFQKHLDQGQLDMIQQKYHVQVTEQKGSQSSSNMYDLQGDRDNLIRFFTSNEWIDACGGQRMNRDEALRQYPQLAEGSSQQPQSQSQDQSQGQSQNQSHNDQS